MRQILKFLNPLNWFKKSNKKTVKKVETPTVSKQVDNIESVIIKVKNHKDEPKVVTLFNPTIPQSHLIEIKTDNNTISYESICRQLSSDIKFHVKGLKIISNFTYQPDEFMEVKIVRKSITGNCFVTPILLFLAKEQQQLDSLDTRAMGRSIDFSLDVQTQVEIPIKPLEEVLIAFIGHF